MRLWRRSRPPSELRFFYIDAMNNEWGIREEQDPKVIVVVVEDLLRQLRRYGDACGAARADYAFRDFALDLKATAKSLLLAPP